LSKTHFFKACFFIALTGGYLAKKEFAFYVEKAVLILPANQLLCSNDI
jgi:hypothetical protein